MVSHESPLAMDSKSLKNKPWRKLKNLTVHRQMCFLHISQNKTFIFFITLVIFEAFYLFDL